MIDQLLDQRYQILQVLGAGGFGRTYIAQDLKQPSHPKCVVKQLKPLGIEDPTLSDASREDRWTIARDFFRKEAEALETLGKHERIPQLLAYFEENQEFYLVQEFIDGHPLSSELVKGQGWPESNVIEMLGQILEVLDFVHSNNAIHRDIKPDNIIRRQHDNALVLVDFGAVKQVRGQMVSESGAISFTVSVGTQGYRPMEQAVGRPRLNSDLYALGMIGIQALTGLNALELETEHRDPYSEEINWQHLAPEVSPGLKDFITRMVRQNWRERYQSAKDALSSLKSDSEYQPTIAAPVSASPTSTTSAFTPASASASAPASAPASTPASTPASSSASSAASSAPVAGLPQASLNRKIMLGAAGVVAFAVLGLGAWLIEGSLSRQGNGQGMTNPSASQGNLGMSTQRISSGEAILLPAEVENNQKFTQLKQEGVQAMAAQNYWQATAKFEAALEQSRNAPETRIYLNNAKIGNNPAYTLAASVPTNSPDRAKEMLRGFAQAQDEVNKQGGINGVPLKLVIVNDQDDPDNIENLARELAANSEILGVMGHNRTEVSKRAGAIYRDANLVLVTPISVMDELTDGSNPYLFRTNRIDTRKGAQALADRVVQTGGLQNVVIFNNPKLEFIRDLTDSFAKELGTRGQILETFDLSSANFNPERSLRTARERGAEAIVLFPSIKTLPQIWKILRLIDEYPNEFGNFKVLGDIATLYRYETLNEGREAAVDMVLAVAWRYSPSDPFSQRADQLWGASVNWVTAMSYDAAQSLVEAIQRNGPTREGIQTALAASDFSTTGASGTIQFIAGDVPSDFALVKVQKMPSIQASRSKTGYDFVPTE
ncbi:bifunctional serine/threonine-protein kinase/ABC transporter substrate-binding protein [Phormidium sp. CCY1219]|uniref:bifunctional serine/threonine-protein kinase/ABC transporter substrate-binding protein n=1 Tax=Phormidium sp. CCY1219 TaxID=2886104 RepID=UPI002D1EEF3E|nr:bifunctional serine/threonine-protein kinase/ABC transporter substrate-binding protein [Phormidium sp. CCY1219]MEB3826122.1 bifunctional serine/threonine-protein kinase/ABC transporter substrate-binding protein [Phormidium sp. CCY1219]